MIWFVIIAIPVGLRFLSLRDQGKVGNFPGNAGNALMQLHTFVRPSVQNIAEAKTQREEKDDKGDDGPPDLPPWVQSD